MVYETSEEYKNRISKLRIPPNWKHVKVSKDPSDYLQVTGYDNKGRIQYIYHPLFIELTTDDKFQRLKDFARIYPKLDYIIKKDLRSSNPKKQLIAFLFKILQKTYIRVGNEVYAKNNKTYGLTTLLIKHVTIDSNIVNIKFIGKKGQKQNIIFRDPYIANILNKLIERSKKAKTNKIFVYPDPETGMYVPIKATELNEYLLENLKKFSDEIFTCKDFRTYFSNIIFIEKLKKYYKVSMNPTQSKKLINKIYEEVAEQLGHTKAISKKAYILPKIAEQFIENKPFFKNNSTYIFRKLIDLE